MSAVLQLDYPGFIRELIDLEGRGHAYAPGLLMLLREVQYSFLGQFEGDVEAKAGMQLPHDKGKLFADEICLLLQQAVARDAGLCLRWLVKTAQALVRTNSTDVAFPAELQSQQYIACYHLFKTQVGFEECSICRFTEVLVYTGLFMSPFITLHCEQWSSQISNQGA